ncbi:TPA: hypothetical protein N6V61_002060 [Escherichia coli]|nr:hypothetical protein [Escherichia coli]
MNELKSKNENSTKSNFPPVDNQFCFYHVDFSIERLLSTAEDLQLEYIFQKPGSGVRKDLVERFERGERFVTASHCDNFCEILGCQGHQENA